MFLLCGLKGLNLNSENFAVRYETLQLIQLACILGGGEGDPHFLTLDGLSYSFNGRGEFVLIRATEFELQGRTERPMIDGSLSYATVFVSVVGQQKSPSSDVIEIKINSAGTGVGWYFNNTKKFNI